MGSWETQWWAKGSGLGLQAADIGIVAAHGGVGRRQGYLGHRHSPNGLPWLPSAPIDTTKGLGVTLRASAGMATVVAMR